MNRPMDVSRADLTLKSLRHRADYQELLDKAARLRVLTPEATDEQVLEIVGDAKWVLKTCNHCERRVRATVQVGEDPDHDSSTANICLDCAKAAVAALEAECVHQ